MRIFCFVALLFFFSCKSTTYYIVRHAEKEQGTTMLSDPPLSAVGEKQAVDLKNYLQGRNIKAIYATNYARTIATAEPLRKDLGINLRIYDAQKPDQVVEELQKISDGNVLVVGHSNTVDDVVNGLMGEARMTDLPDTEYGSLFIVKRKGNTYRFEKMKVPQTAARP